MNKVIIKKNFRFGSLLISNLICASLIFISIKESYYQCWIIFWPLLLISIFSWFYLKEMIITENEILWRHYFSKKQIWKIEKQELKEIYVVPPIKGSGFSKVFFKLNNNNRKYMFTNLPGWDIDDLIKIIDNFNAVFYMKIDYKWVKYEPKKWIKY